MLSIQTHNKIGSKSINECCTKAENELNFKGKLFLKFDDEKITITTNRIYCYIK